MDLDTFLQDPKVLPTTLLILPLSVKPMFPGLFCPIMVTGERDMDTVNQAIAGGGIIGTLLEKADAEGENLTAEDRFYSVGTMCRILKSIKLPDGGVNLYVATQNRFRVEAFDTNGNITVAKVTYLRDKPYDRERILAWVRSLTEELKTISGRLPMLSDENRLNLVNIEDPSKFADYMASILSIEGSKLQKILEELDVKKRIEDILFHIEEEKRILQIQGSIREHVNKKLEKNQRDYFLREELRQIQKELGIVQSKTDLVEKLKQDLDRLNLKGEAKETVENEYARFSTLEPSSPEYALSLNYLQTIAALPWKDEPFRDYDMARAKRILDAEHYGMEEVKDRVLEFLAVRKRKQDTKGAIICLVGPPGVGKTSIGLSIAKAMGRKCYRFSVGGMKDEAEIKGHRRTYVGALPGKIIQGLKIVKTKSPVFLIDEIDKMGESYQGDPASALLEALDPEQNKDFRDRYLDLPFDISQVLFIVTANTLDTIPSPLLDRMEIIELSGYTSNEKLNIGKKYLLPKSLEKNGLDKKDVKYPAKSLLRIAEGYAREAGVRNFEKALDKINRKIARASLTEEDFEFPVTVSEDLIVKYLGKAPFSDDEVKKADKVGTSIGLAWTSMGGDTLLIEAKNYPGKGELSITGQLGDVMKESVSIAWTYLKREAVRRNIDYSFFERYNVHLHIPEGATPKDGPSAGITLTVALYSLLTDQVMKSGLAMTGELTLTGQVMPIGGLKEKVLAARRNGIDTIIIPWGNRNDLEKLSEEVKSGITFRPVRDMQEVLAISFPDDTHTRMSEEEYRAKEQQKAEDEKAKAESNDLKELLAELVKRSS